MTEPTATQPTYQAHGEGRRVAWPRLALATAVAALIAVVGNAALYLLASAAGLVNERVVLPSLIGTGPLSLATVALTSAVAVVGAGILLGVLAATTRRALRMFRIAASALALLSLSTPATIPGPSSAMRLTMALMHVMVWAVSVGVLPTLASRRRQVTA
jgi:hypothetical protein